MENSKFENLEIWEIRKIDNWIVGQLESSKLGNLETWKIWRNGNVKFENWKIGNREIWKMGNGEWENWKTGRWQVGKLKCWKLRKTRNLDNCATR